ncbi:MAG: SPOR domain-containing protein [Steroidobacteraceae bacterium]|jgi:cell division protein FtsN
MRINKTPWVILGAVLLALSACSRQQSDWQKTREANTTDSYELFIKKYPSGEFTAQAQARLKELYEERDWQKARDADTPEAYQAFLKQYPEGKWTEEARIRVENFTLAQTPAAGPGSPAAAAPGAAPPAAGPAAGPGGATPPSTAQTSETPPHAATPGENATTSKPESPAAAAKSASGTYGVQLGAFGSGTAAANERWVRLQKQYPKLLAGLSSKIVPKKTKSGTLYRLQAVGVTEAHARRICKDLKAKSQPCVVVRPARA